MARASQLQSGFRPGPVSPRSSTVEPRWSDGTSVLLLLPIYLLLAAIGAYIVITWPLDAGIKVTREELGAPWPLTVSDGTLRCEAGGEITLQDGGTTYSLTRHVKHGAYSDVGRIRADDPAGGKKDLSPLIERGTRLCR